MSNHLYHTEGLILGYRDRGEGSRIFFVLTPDLGLIQALAQGVRELKSKLRFSAREQTFVDLNVVRGREYWRLTGLEGQNDLNSCLTDDVKRKLVARVSLLLRNLIHGEEGNPALYRTLKQGLAFAAKFNAALFAAKEKNLEYVLVLRLLKHLGYLKEEPSLSLFVNSPDWREDLVAGLAKHERAAVAAINHALHHTQI